MIAVVGATATGKSALSIDLAERLGGEVVNADAFLLYRGMTIGTAKLTTAQRRGIPHHQIDVLDIHQEASVADYQRTARADMGEITRRSKTPLLVGGSGLYLRAALDQLVIPPTDRAVRSRLEGELTSHGSSTLHRRLQRLDPAAAAMIDPRHGRRIVRALEVVELTGRPFAAAMPPRRFVRPTVMIAIDVPRPTLDARIAERTRRMWQGGFLEEVRGLAELGLARTPTASRAVGYRQALAHLEGCLTEGEAIEATTAATRRLARRQLSWFVPDGRVHWLRHDTDLAEAAMRIVQEATESEARFAASPGTGVGPGTANRGAVSSALVGVLPVSRPGNR